MQTTDNQRTTQAAESAEAIEKQLEERRIIAQDFAALPEREKQFVLGYVAGLTARAEAARPA